MSASEVVDLDENGADDVDMGGEDNGDGEAGTNGENGTGGLENIETSIPERESFIDYLKSPVVELNVTDGEETTTLYAHQTLLKRSTYLVEQLSSSESSLDLTEDILAFSSLLEYLYKGDYFPTISSSSSLETDPTVPQPDTTGLALLRHARIYTLARKFALPSLSALAHRKIHLVDSTARGEIEYARYVYGHTDDGDKDIRRPVAQFWATRSHVLRHEAEAEFRAMCLDFPRFGFDVLSMVLDAQERRSGKTAEATAASTGSARKRARVSHS